MTIFLPGLGGGGRVGWGFSILTFITTFTIAAFSAPSSYFIAFFLQSFFFSLLTFQYYMLHFESRFYIDYLLLLHCGRRLQYLSPLLSMCLVHSCLYKIH